MHLSSADDTRHQMNVNEWLLRKQMLCLVWERQKHLSINAFLLPSLVLVLWVFILFLLYLLSVHATRHRHGGTDEWVCAQTHKTVNVLLPFGLWRSHPVVSDPRPKPPALKWTVWECWISNGSALRPDLSPAWMELVLGGGYVSCLDSQLANYPLAAVESELPLVDGTTHDNRRKNSTHISVLYNSPSGIPSSKKTKRLVHKLSPLWWLVKWRLF